MEISQNLSKDPYETEMAQEDFWVQTLRPWMLGYREFRCLEKPPKAALRTFFGGTLILEGAGARDGKFQDETNT